MAYTLLVTYIDSQGMANTFDVSTIAHNIEFTTSLNSQPGKFSFYLEKDPTEQLKIAIGSPVQFFSNGKAIFFGKVFAIETDSTEVYRVTAYDMMRYLKNNDAILVDGDKTLITLFKKILEDSGIKAVVGKWANGITMLPLEAHHFWNETLFDILDYYMGLEIVRNTLTYDSDGNIDQVGRRFYLKCHLDAVELREIQYDFFHDDNGKLKDSFLMIGDESLMTDFNYKIDIDKETFNRLIFVANIKDDSSSISDDTNTQIEEKQMVAAMDAGYTISNTGTSLDGKTIGENTTSKWGVLSKVIELKNTTPQNELEEYMKAALSVYSLPNRTLKLNAMGYDGVIAGSGFYLHLSKLDINYPVYVISATHRYDADEHMMELEVCTNVSMRKFL